MKKWILSLIPLLGLVSMEKHPFDYDLHLTAIPGKSARTMICFHGSGANYQLIETLKDQVEETLVGFNFPDHDFQSDDPEKASFGTIQELLPALYVLKTYVIDNGLNEIDLYGFSAGGGALVNTLAVLNAPLYDKELEKIGIGAKEKTAILKAIQNGRVFLDSPLKSIEEIIELRGSSNYLEGLAVRYKKNGLRPIDSLEFLKGLSLHITLYFESPDEILSNRDDALYIQRLKKYNKGTTKVLIGTEGGHCAIHSSIWEES
jgi:hypothetical protein